MPTVVYAVLEETPLGACVSDVYRECADALTAAENAARQKGEIDPSFRWRVVEREVVENPIASLARPAATVV